MSLQALLLHAVLLHTVLLQAVLLQAVLLHAVSLHAVLLHECFDVSLTMQHSIDLFRLPIAMHNSFIHEQYVYYITILDIFRASTCPSSGGQIVLSQHLVSSLSVQPFIESDDTRCCDNTICPAGDGHVDARNM
jgi:hypothetical protein